jgi:hypothetical protein
VWVVPGTIASRAAGSPCTSPLMHRYADEPAHPAGMPECELQGHAGPQAVPGDVGPVQPQVVGQRRDVVGQELAPQRPADVGRAPVPLQLNGDDLRLAG